MTVSKPGIARTDWSERVYGVLAWIILLRGLYAVALFFTLNSVWIVDGNPLELSGHLADLVRNISPALIAAWLSYCLIYVTAGVLALRRNRWTIFVFLFAMIVDYGVWLSVSLNPRYDMILSGAGLIADVMFNVLDLAILTLLLICRMRQRARAGQG